VAQVSPPVGSRLLVTLPRVTGAARDGQREKSYARLPVVASGDDTIAGSDAASYSYRSQDRWSVPELLVPNYLPFAIAR
jgi:hypothetical protein